MYSIARRSFRRRSLVQSTLVLSAMLLIQSCGGGSSAPPPPPPPPPPAAATPSFWPGAGTYSPTQITLSDTTANATIYYTTDGSTPNTSSFAGYFVKYLQAYSAAGISVDYISLQNEPLFVPGN